MLWAIAERPEPLPLRAALLRELGDCLGLSLSGPAPLVEADASIEQLVARRTAARKAGDCALSDALRAELLAQGVVVQDSATGSTFRRE